MIRWCFREWWTIGSAFILIAFFSAVSGYDTGGISKFYNAAFNRVTFWGLYLPCFTFGLFRVSDLLSKGEIAVRFGSCKRIIRGIQMMNLGYSIMITCITTMILLFMAVPFSGVDHLKRAGFYLFMSEFSLLQLIGWFLICNIYWCFRLVMGNSISSWIATNISAGLPACFYGDWDISSQAEFVACIYKCMFIIEGNSTLYLLAHGIYMMALSAMIICIIFTLLKRIEYMGKVQP